MLSSPGNHLVAYLHATTSILLNSTKARGGMECARVRDLTMSPGHASSLPYNSIAPARVPVTGDLQSFPVPDVYRHRGIGLAIEQKSGSRIQRSVCRTRESTVEMRIWRVFERSLASQDRREELMYMDRDQWYH